MDRLVGRRPHEFWNREGGELPGATVPGIGAARAGALRLDGAAISHISDISAEPAPRGEGARLRRLGQRVDSASSDEPGHVLLRSAKLVLQGGYAFLMFNASTTGLEFNNGGDHCLLQCGRR